MAGGKTVKKACPLILLTEEASIFPGVVKEKIDLKLMRFTSN